MTLTRTIEIVIETDTIENAEKDGVDITNHTILSEIKSNLEDVWPFDMEIKDIKIVTQSLKRENAYLPARHPNYQGKDS